MIFIAFGRWNHSAGSWFVRERIYRHSCWTPFVWVRWRYELAMHIAYALPRSIVNWTLIRAWVHATSEQWENEDATSITMSEVTKRWENKTQ